MARRQVVGVVVSNRTAKTLLIQVTRLVRHPVYRRVMRRAKRLMVDDADSKARLGDEVRVEQTRPLSRRKRWRLVAVLRPAEKRE